MATPFVYAQAFSRNIGWVTREEQALLRTRRVAIAGMGGVGGIHLLTLARLGIGAFSIADFDVFALENFNRQVGATLSSVGASKVETLARMALDINPELDIRTFPQGVRSENVADFLQGADLYVDGMDFFAFADRQAIFSACHEQGIPQTTAGPMGMSAALLNFLPGGMSFEEYFGWGDLPDEEKGIRFLLGLAPARLQFQYLVDPTSVDFSQHRGPSTGMACQICAGMAATEALKILLKRGKVWAAPYGLQFDAYRSRFARTWRPGGNRNPVQRVALSIARRRLEQLKRGNLGR